MSTIDAATPALTPHDWTTLDRIASGAAFFSVMAFGVIGPAIAAMQLFHSVRAARTIIVAMPSLFVLGVGVFAWWSTSESAAFMFQQLLALYSSIALFLAAAFVCGELSRRISWRRHPQTFAIGYLFRALRRLETQKAKWQCPDGRYKLLGDLENAALLIEAYLPRRLRTDRETDDWLRSQTRKIAAAIRELKKWVCTPQSTTYQDLRNVLAAEFVHALTGEWGHMRTAEPTPRRKQYLTTAIDWTRAILIAGVPWLLLVLFDRSFPDRVPLPAFLLTYAWMLVTLALQLDPHVRDRAAAFKELMAIIPGLRSKGND